MSTLYERIALLCREGGYTVTAMCKAAQVSRSSLTDLKSGRKQTLSADTLSRIAGCLGTTVDHLLTGEAPAGPRPITNAELKFALWGDAVHMDDADLDDVFRYAAFVAERKKEQK